MKCETVSLTKIDKFGKSPEGRNIPYVEIIHKKRCSKELNNLREEEEAEENDVEKEDVEQEKVEEVDELKPEDEEMKTIREGFQRFLKK